jgi:hypothetical protein
MITSFTSEETILPNAAPMMTATARSTTLPRMMNSLKSLTIVASFIADLPKSRPCGPMMGLALHWLPRQIFVFPF